MPDEQNLFQSIQTRLANNDIVLKINKILDRIPFALKYSFMLFIISRFSLILIGIVTRDILPYPTFWKYSEYDWLDMWALWDSGYYMGLAEHGYETNPSADLSRYAFFPFYPLLIHIFNYLVGSYLISAILISNLSLLGSGIFLYQIVKEIYSDKIASQSLKFLYFFPSSFVLSGVFSESLFLFLILGSIYFAKKGNFMVASIFGYFASLTKVLGILVGIIVLYEYLRNIDFDIKLVKFNILFLGLIPLGLGSYMIYSWINIDDPWIFITIQGDWNRVYLNPLRTLYDGMFAISLPYAKRWFISWFIFVYLVILFFSLYEIDPVYWLWSFLMIMIPLSTAWYSIGWFSLPRHMLPIFPMYFILAKLSNNELIEDLLTVICLLFQGFLMVFWSIGNGIIV